MLGLKRSNGTRTYREPPSLPQLLAPVIAVIIANFVLSTREISNHPHSWLPSLTTLTTAFLVGALVAGLSRRSAAATMITPDGVRVRQTASKWRLYAWRAISDVDMPHSGNGDATLRLRTSAAVRLRGLPLERAESLAALVAERTAGHRP